MSGEYFIDLENTGGYRKFIRVALKCSDSIGISYTSDFSAFKESKWWQLLGGSVTRHKYDEDGSLILYLKIDYVTCEWLKAKRSIFDFWDSEDDQQLWDLCLYREDMEILASITHEKDLWISDELRQSVCANLKYASEIMNRL